MNAKLIRLCGAALCAGALLLSPATSKATVLVPGGTVVPDILIGPAGTLVDSLLTPLVGSPDVIAAMRTAVVRNAGGTLDFYYQIGNSGISDFALNMVSSLSFAIPAMTFATDVFFRLENGGLPFFHIGSPAAAPLTSSRSADGVVVDFNFRLGNLNAPRINSGEVSRILVIRTNATNYVPGLTTASNGSVLVAGPSFAPSAVPEPTSLLLLSSAFAAAGYVARHRASRRKPPAAV